MSKSRLPGSHTQLLRSSGKGNLGPASVVESQFADLALTASQHSELFQPRILPFFGAGAAAASVSNTLPAVHARTFSARSTLLAAAANIAHLPSASLQGAQDHVESAQPLSTLDTQLALNGAANFTPLAQDALLKFENAFAHSASPHFGVQAFLDTAPSPHVPLVTTAAPQVALDTVTSSTHSSAPHFELGFTRDFGSPDPDGQLWFAGVGTGTGNPDGHSDFRIEHADSDGLANDQIIQQEQPSTGLYQAVGLDTAASLSFSLDGSNQGFHFRVTNLNTGVDLSSTVIASASDLDVVNGFVVNTHNDTIYMDLFGGDYTVVDGTYPTHARGGELLKFTYNPATGSISYPYDPVSFSNNANNILIDSASTNHVFADGRAYYLSQDGSTLYYVDDNNNDPGSYWGFGTNGVFKVSTTGDVGHGTAPTPTLLSVQAAFPTNDSNGYITGITVDEAKGVIYFTTDAGSEGINLSQDGIWWMPIAGGTATKMTMPSGTVCDFPVFYGNALTIDPHGQNLYYSDAQTGTIYQLVLSADGQSFTSGSVFSHFDTNSGSDGAVANDMVFDTLSTLSGVTGTTTEALQGGSAVTLLTGAPTITDIDGPNLAGVSIVITNAQSGDLLSVNGVQSGTVDGGKVTVTWNAGTHTLTLSGDVPDADYQTLLSQIKFQDTGTDNSTGSHPTRSITWIANDGVTVVHPTTSDPNEQVTTLTIDRAPTLVADHITVFESATATGTSGTGGTGVLGNDSDKDADALVLTAVNGSAGNLGVPVAGTYGELTLNSDGSYSYVADNTTNINAQADNAVLTDSFTYTVSDGLGGTSTTTLTFTVDQPPTVTSFDAAATSGADFTASHTVTFTLDTGKNVTVAGGTTLALSDGGTATYVSGSGTQTIIFSYSATDAPGALTVSGISAGSIADSAGNALVLAGTAVGTYTDAVSDTAANVSTFLDSLESHHANISSITLTDGGTPDLDMTANQYLNDGDAVALIVSAYNPVILDTAADVQAALANLETSITGNPGSISSVQFTDAGTPTVTVTAAQYASDSDIINLFSGTYAIIVTGSGTTPEAGFSGTLPTYTQFEVFNGSADYTVYSNTDGSQTFVYTSGTTIDDSASTHNDFFDLSQDSNYDITGGSGNDSIYFGANFDSSDTVNGGGGTNNQIGFSGDYSSGTTLQGSQISNIQVIACLPGFDYTLTAASDLLGSGQSMTIWAAHLAAANTLIFDGSQLVSGGSFTVYGGAGNDTITGGSGNDNIYGLGGADLLTGGAGNDTFFYTAVTDSTSTSYDTITDFNASADKFDLPGSVTGIDATIATGALNSGGSFDSDLATAAAALGVHHAVLFTPDSGTLSGHTFLIVDANGSAGYQAGADYVFDITGATNLGSLATGDFI